MVINISIKPLHEVTMNNHILDQFAEAEILVHPPAYQKLIETNMPLELTQSLIKYLKEEELLVLTTDIIEKYLSEDISVFDAKNKDEINQEAFKDDTVFQPKNFIFDFQIIRDASRKSYTSGDIKDFSAYFGSRYHKLNDMLKRKNDLHDHIPLREVDHWDNVVRIIGMVSDIRDTRNNHKLIEIEDETGSCTVLIHNENEDLYKTAEKIVKDEVIGIVGTRKGSLIIASKLIHPGIPRVDDFPMDFSVVFLSDTHIGSSNFLEDAFLRFIGWINGEYGNEKQRQLANDVKYLVVAGDIVDGIGVYPSQDKELIIKDIYKQYEKAAELFSMIEGIKIIFAPGNHDACRLAEPQPAIPEEYAPDLYKLKNAEFVSNPSVVSLDGLITLIYHGRSFDDFAMTVKGMSHQKSDIIMRELLEKRHLAPIYGERTPLASEFEDHMVIEDFPHVFHTGHVHINSYKRYKGIHMINSGTFQSQTEFQKIYNIIPTCAQVPILSQGQMNIINFA